MSTSPIQPLKLQQWRLFSWLGLPFALAFTISSGFVLPVLIHTLFPGAGWAPAVLLGLFVAAAGCSVVVSCLRTLRMKGPALVLDEHGLADLRKDGVNICWNQVEKMKLDTWSDDDRIVIRLRDAAQSTGIGNLKVGIKRLFSGGDLNVNLTGLRYDQRELARTIAAYMARATAERVQAARQRIHAGGRE